ncbi:MAG: cytochrome c3 family protein [Gammaproteobacteria bacterium]|nr:cytochrome c3 family protein [Gammaproteobacteria bacterium]
MSLGTAAMLLIVASALLAGAVVAAPKADIRNTRHNFSATNPPTLPGGAERDAHATSESQICAFCHTPHRGTDEPKAPLWNRQLSVRSYAPYTSSSLDATDLGQPTGKSKLCLSCHDGSIALGSVNVLNRVENPDIPFTSTDADGHIPQGLGEFTGFTRRLGVDLTNDHPISFTFDSLQAVRDGELRDPAVESHVGERNVKMGLNPKLPLEDGKMECITCHDPHLSDPDSEVSIKFLRVNRLQQVEPTSTVFDENNDIICLGCHDKKGWVGSAHANAAVGNEMYTDSAAQLREFPLNTQVWQAACLNCHDPHTVQGARRLLREGTDGPIEIDPKSGAKFKRGGEPAVEQVCFACHSAGMGTLQGQGTTNFEVPDIKTDFTTMLRHMPVASSDQAAGFEVHAIGTGTDGELGTQRGQDFVESRENLGKGNLANRHAECTDCHNPHRVMKNRLFNADNTIPDAGGTHRHEDGVPHNNLASGVLRGIFGVQPTAWSSTEFGANPISFDAKRGDGGPGASTDVNAPYVTREYQLCMKCHSNFTYDTPPDLGSFSGGTPPGTNDMFQYTNQGMEYQSPVDHMGEGTSLTPSGAFQGPDGGGNMVDYMTNNHRSWHPVLRETGRTPAVRGADAENWTPPFNAAVGTQTMYCTDCHGSNTPPGTAVPVGGENGFVWGPHGSNNNFLLKGDWSDQTGGQSAGGTGGKPADLCFKCHDFGDYGQSRNPLDLPGASGFKIATQQPQGCIEANFLHVNLHSAHITGLTGNNFFRCTFCHVAVPHGWKNKVFLANLNDIGLEGNEVPGTQVRRKEEARYYNGPYYNGSTLKVRNFARSGEWIPDNCGSSGEPGNGQFGVNWMTGQMGAPNARVSDPNSESCRTIP